jgi:hypothetical protein
MVPNSGYSRIITGGIMSTPVNIDTALTDDQFRIIGLELKTYTNLHGQQELAMFATSLVLPRLRSLPRTYPPYDDYYAPSVTIHTTLGDYTLMGMGDTPVW